MSPYEGAIFYSVFAPRILIEIVLKAVPTESGSCTTVLAAVIQAIDSSKVLLAASEEAERSNASPIPPDEIAKLFNLLLSVC